MSVNVHLSVCVSLMMDWQPVQTVSPTDGNHEV